MMGHKVALESSYERYEEADFECFTEYQKAIPFLTISDEERQKTKIETLESKQKDIENLKDNMEKIIAEKINQYSSKFITDLEKMFDDNRKQSRLQMKQSDLKLFRELSENDLEFEKMKSVYDKPKKEVKK